MPRIPDKGEYVRGFGVLVKTEEIPPPPQPPPHTEYIFEETEARTEFRLHGKVLERHSTFNDFYGPGTSVQTAIETAKRTAEKNGITPKSDLEVVAVKIVSQCRFRPLDRANLYDKEFNDFAFLDWGAKRDLPEPVETVVWSSKNP